MTYDTGFVVHGQMSREHFHPEVVRRELAIIRDDLHCNAIQIIGGDPDRLELAATAAAELGLEVWFSPYPLELGPEQILTLFRDCAERAERLRQQGAGVVFVAGVELSVMNRGFLPGESPEERVEQLMSRPERRAEAMRELGVRINAFLRDAAAAVRERFQGKLTYASIQFEQVDWTPFDIVTFELIRSAEVADRFRDAVRTLARDPKPLAITGFGTAAYRGAGDRGGRVLEVVEYDPGTRAPVRLNGVYERDEAGHFLGCRRGSGLFRDQCAGPPADPRPLRADLSDTAVRGVRAPRPVHGTANRDPVSGAYRRARRPHGGRPPLSLARVRCSHLRHQRPRPVWGRRP
ncbi:hypothetical protein ACTMTU_05885 [Streptomyces sp. OZ13]|uniref:hypothetical protein n=1 Tax=Streptomyces sp. OZ13 TaxID=3452210 RepID=UPI003F8CD9DF